MLAEFSIENFYSIRSQQTLSFVPSPDKQLGEMYTVEVRPGVRLLKLGMIYGANASGKSKILNALDFLTKFLVTFPADKMSGTGTMPFMLDDHSRNEPTRMQLTFYLEKERYILSIQFDQERIYSEKLVVYATTQPTLLYERTYVHGLESTRVEFGNAIGLGKRDQDIITGNTLNNCSVLAAFGKSNVAKSRLNRVFDWLSNTFSQTITPSNNLSQFLHEELKSDKDGSMRQFIMRFLRASDFNISEFHLSSDASSIVFSHETLTGAGTLAEEQESNGTIRFMGISALLKYLIKDNRFILIDEIETSLHYELLTYFLRVYLANRTGTSQLLFATHDINLLDEDFIRRDTIWFTDKNEEAETELVRLSTLGLHKNLSPYNAYRQGKLVKLPFTGNIFIEEAEA